MNKERLQIIFRNYLEKFEMLNAPEPGLNEKYKWEIAYGFRTQMDDAICSSAEDMPAKLSALVVSASNLLQNQYELPGAALCEYSKKEPETVRSLLSAFFEDDGGDLDKRQKKIEAFILGCNDLKRQYYPDSFRYEMGQRAAMVFLGLYDPEQNYIYKATQANEFADCVEFYDDWGPSTRFKLSVYYRMCDQLVEYMKADDALIAAHQSRYNNPQKPLHADKNLHILAFDIIYSCSHYHLMNNIDYEHISSGERKKYLENQNRAEALEAELEEAAKTLQQFHEAVKYYSAFLTPGSPVKHVKFGEGVITSSVHTPGGNQIVVRFPGDMEKAFNAEWAVVKGFLLIDAPDLKEKNDYYKSVILKGEAALTAAVSRAEAALNPLREYLL